MLLSKFYNIGVSESVGSKKNSVNVGKVDRMRVSERNAENLECQEMPWSFCYHKLLFSSFHPFLPVVEKKGRPAEGS